MFKLLTVKGDKTSRPQCWWWKGIHPYIYIFDYMKRRHVAPMSMPCWWWKEIHPHVHCWLLKWIHLRVHTLLVVERDIPSCSHCGNEKYTLTFPLLAVETYKPLRVNARIPEGWKKVSPALAFSPIVNRVSRHQHSGIKVSLIPLVTNWSGSAQLCSVHMFLLPL